MAGVKPNNAAWSATRSSSLVLEREKTGEYACLAYEGTAVDGDEEDTIGKEGEKEEEEEE